MPTPIVILIAGRHQQNVVNSAVSVGVGEVRRRRASHVLPVPFLARLLFRAVRSVVRDDSAAAAWTRAWPVAWYADLAPSNGPKLGPFTNRLEAIEAEVLWLTSNSLGDKS